MNPRKIIEKTKAKIDPRMLTLIPKDKTKINFNKHKLKKKRAKSLTLQLMMIVIMKINQRNKMVNNK